MFPPQPLSLMECCYYPGSYGPCDLPALTGSHSALWEVLPSDGAPRLPVQRAHDRCARTLRQVLHTPECRLRHFRSGCASRHASLLRVPLLAATPPGAGLPRAPQARAEPIQCGSPPSAPPLATAMLPGVRPPLPPILCEPRCSHHSPPIFLCCVVRVPSRPVKVQRNKHLLRIIRRLAPGKDNRSSGPSSGLTYPNVFHSRTSAPFCSSSAAAIMWARDKLAQCGAAKRSSFHRCRTCRSAAATPWVMGELSP